MRTALTGGFQLEGSGPADADCPAVVNCYGPSEFSVSATWCRCAPSIPTWTLGEMIYSSAANAYLGGLAPPNLVGRYQGLCGAALTAGTGLGPLIGGADDAVNEWAPRGLVGVAGLLSAHRCLPTRRFPPLRALGATGTSPGPPAAGGKRARRP